jgi:hypothetical protein
MNSKENKITEYKTLSQIVEQLEKCDYTTKDQLHDLKNNAAFVVLKQMAREDKEIREMLKKMNDESPLIEMEDNTVDNAVKFIFTFEEKNDDNNWQFTTQGTAELLVAYANKFLL